MTHRFLLRFLCALFAAPALAAPAAGPALHVAFGGRAVDLTPEAVAAMPHQEVSAYDGHDKRTHHYAGVPVRDVLALVGAPSGEKLRGQAMRLVVIARARDGYAVAFSLAEFDPAFSDRTPLLVDRQDGQPLGPRLAPFRLLIPGDQRPARWEHMVISLEIVPAGGT